MKKNQTQRMVTAWIEESFPNATMKRRIKHLFEEVTELAVALQADLTEDDLHKVIAHVWKRASQHRKHDVEAEVGDTQIAMIGIASQRRISIQTSLNKVMRRNLRRPLTERRRKEEAKQRLVVFKS